MDIPVDWTIISAGCSLNSWDATVLANRTIMFGCLTKSAEYIEQAGKDSYRGAPEYTAILSLGRAILHKLGTDSRIPLVDEASSAVDVETAPLMRIILNEAFSNCTAITISHGPDSIKSADVVVEIDDRRIVSIAERRDFSSRM